MTRVSTLLLVTLLLSGCGTDVSGPSSSLLACVLGEAREMAPGDVVQVRGLGNQALCVSPGGSGGEFVFIPFFGAPPDEDDELTLSVEVSGGGFGAGVAADGSEAAASARQELPVTGGIQVDWTFHDRLRRRELEELGGLIRAGGGSAADAFGIAASIDVPSVGDLLELNVSVDCSTEEMRTGRVMSVSDHAVVVADTTNPAEHEPEDYAYFAITFDTLVYPIGTDHFGTPTDIDGNGRSILFFTEAVNRFTSRDDDSVVLGFFWSGDLFPAEGTDRLDPCPAGNRAEMFYLLAPDPDGAVGPVFSLSAIRHLAIVTIGHEYQHLVNASRRLHVNDARKLEEVWLNEALSHIAEELVFYAAAGLQPSQNLTAAIIQGTPGATDAFRRYMAYNLYNFSRYLARPDTASVMRDDDFSTRGAAWAFLRYAADRSDRGDEAFFFDVVNSQTAGVENLEEVLGPGATFEWMRDWTVSIYTDDFLDGMEPRFRLPSWHLRSIYPNTTVNPNRARQYPLSLQTLRSDDPASVELLPGGAAFMRFGIEGGGRAVIHVEADGGVPPQPLRGSLIRVR